MQRIVEYLSVLQSVLYWCSTNPRTMTMKRKERKEMKRKKKHAK